MPQSPTSKGTPETVCTHAYPEHVQNKCFVLKLLSRTYPNPPPPPPTFMSRGRIIKKFNYRRL